MKSQFEKITQLAFIEALKEEKKNIEFSPEEKMILLEKKIISKKTVDTIKLIKSTIGGTLVN